MVAKLEGKSIRKGVSRAGNNYTALTIHYLKKERDVEGLAAVQKTVFSDIGYDRLIVGQYYNFDFDENGNLMSFSPAKS